MYEIAKYLTLEQRRRAAAETYTVDCYSTPANEGGYCAIGVALKSDSKMPTPGWVARLILGKDYLGLTQDEAEQWDQIAKAADRFTQDFDNGKITDVAKAMGVQRPKSSDRSS